MNQASVSGGRLRLRAASAFLLCLSGFVGTPGCYEIPPRAGARSLDAAPGNGPAAVYGGAPLHPANRWFVRAFGRRDGEGTLLGARPDEPWPLLDRPQGIDRAEILAILESLKGEGPPPDAGEIARTLLAEDLLAAGALWAPADPELARAHREVAALVGGGRALKVAAPDVEGLEAAFEDLYRAPPKAVSWGAWLVGSRRPASGSGTSTPLRALLLFRAPAPTGEAGTPRALWVLERREGGLEPRVFRLDRAALREGRPPWRELGAGEGTAVRDPRSGRLLEGELHALCLSCHPVDAPWRGAP